MITLVLVAITFVILIVPHELGHLWAAKAFGIRVDKFSLGFGPRVWSTRRGETEYAVSAVPLGGYVKIAGMQPGEEGVERGFQRAPLRQRVVVICAGSLMNYLLAVVLLSTIFMIGFYAVSPDRVVVGEVMEGSPAESAGLQPGDRIVAIQGSAPQDWTDAAQRIAASKGKSLTLTLGGDGEKRMVEVTPRYDEEVDRYLVGITPAVEYIRYDPARALVQGAERTVYVTRLIFTAVGGMIRGTVPAEFTGPVGIAQITGEVAKAGFSPLLEFAAFLSINLALINIFPLPALDGGRIAFVLMEWIRRGKRVSPKIEAMIHMIGFALLMIAIAAVTYQDIIRIIAGESLIP
jgi:regulator of sigma E protease